MQDLSPKFPFGEDKQSRAVGVCFQDEVGKRNPCDSLT